MRKISASDKAGLYLTVIVHLAVIIVLLFCGLGYSLSSESSFVLDFSQQDELERMRQEVELKEAISRKLQEELGGDVSVPGTSDIRNVAVDRGALADDRGTDAEKLYADAARLQQELMQGSRVSSDEYAIPSPENPETAEDTEAPQTSSYTGPSVVAYELAGRKASRLSIPAYRCMGGGEVKVIITVTPSGKVIGAEIDEQASSPDRCLRDFAVRAAKASIFSAKNGASPKESGYIIYRFIAQ